MRYYLCFLTIFLSGCLNVPFIPLVDNEKDLYFLNSKHNKMIYRKVKKLKNLLNKGR